MSKIVDLTDNDVFRNHIRNNVVEPLKELLKKLFDVYELEELYVAGSSCLPNYPAKDIDIFFPKKIYFSDWKDFIVYSTTNALTLSFNNRIVQLCRYHKETPEDLIKSFDFAHIQIAAIIVPEIVVSKIIATEDCIMSNAARTTWYTGSDYPLSSLIRLHKYANILNLSARIIRHETAKIFADAASRGFKDYADLKDQLEAIDLVAENFDDETISKLKQLCLTCEE